MFVKPHRGDKKHMRWALSEGQRAIWFQQQLAPTSTVYNLAHAVCVEAPVNVKRLEQALRQVILKHTLLRVRIEQSGDDIYQIPTNESEYDIVSYDASEHSDEKLLKELDVLANTPINLARGVLRARFYSRSDNTCWFGLVIHHIAVDLWSFGVFLHDLGDVYSGQIRSDDVQVADYGEYVTWQKEMLMSQRLDSLSTFWRQKVPSNLPPLNFPYSTSKGSVPSFSGAKVDFEIESHLLNQLKALGKSKGVTLYSVMLTALFTLLNRYTGQEKIYVGSPFAGRTRARFKHTVGYFVNVLPISANFESKVSFAKLLEQVTADVSGALRRQDFPLSRILSSTSKVISQWPPFDLVFVYERPHRKSDIAPFILGHVGHAQMGEMRWRSIGLKRNSTEFPMHLFIVDSGESLSGALEYMSDLLSQEMAENFVRHYKMVLQAIVVNPDIAVEEISLIDEAEREKLIQTLNGRVVDYGSPNCLHESFEQQVLRTPDSMALRCEQESMTYRELNRRANRLALKLRGCGVGPEIAVGIYCTRSFEMIIGIYAILKAGGAYVPLDPSLPIGRIREMIEDSGADVVLVQPSLSSSAQSLGISNLIDLGDTLKPGLPENDSNIDSGVRSDSLVYIIFTSGSTGRPKGVMIDHSAVFNRLEWMQAEYCLDSEDRVLQKTPIGFDVSVWEIFWPLRVGACLVILEPELHKDANKLVKIVQCERITTMHFVPSMMYPFLDEPDVRNCQNLKRIFCSGEALPNALQKRFFEILKCELHNLYGPTEATVDITYWQCEPNDKSPSVPIGRPIANCQTYVVDSLRQLVPVGVLGELYLGGVQIGRGYSKRPELTSERFIADPFSPHSHARLYRTGDLVRWRNYGVLEYLGRNDSQIKLRGFRIELGEIENVLGCCLGVRQAAVLVGFDKIGEKKLEAFVAVGNHASVSPKILFQELRSRLPEYMIPSTLRILPYLPLTASGKIDRQALSNSIEIQEEPGLVEYIEPRTKTEQVIAEVWSDVL